MKKLFKKRTLFPIIGAIALIFTFVFAFISMPNVYADDQIVDAVSIYNYDIADMDGSAKTLKNWSWQGDTSHQGITVVTEGSVNNRVLDIDVSTGGSITFTLNNSSYHISKVVVTYQVGSYGGDKNEASISGKYGTTVASSSQNGNDITFTMGRTTDNVSFTFVGSSTGPLYFRLRGIQVYENNSAPVTITKGTGVKSVYLSTTENATSGSASGTEFNGGTTVYGFAELAKGYNAPSGWTKVQGTADTEGAIYRVGSVSAGSSNFGTVDATLTNYTITYNLNYGEVATANPATYTIDTPTFTLNNPTKTGYTFKNWNGTIGNQSLNGETITIEQGSIGNITLDAVYDANKYNVIIGGENVEATYGSRLPDVEVPTKEGYTFVEYYYPGGLDYIGPDGKGSRAWDKAENDIELKPRFSKDMAVTSSGYEGTYDGENHTISVTPKDPDDPATGGFTIKYGTVEGTYNLDAAPEYKDAGTYTIYYKITNPNYSATVDGVKISGFTTHCGSETVVINPMPVTADKYETLPKAVSDLVYNDEDFTLITAGALVDDGNDYGDILYRVVAVDGSLNTEYSTELPVGHNATTYTIYYKTSGNGNVGSIPEASFTVIIAEVDKTALATKISEAENYINSIKDDYSSIATNLNNELDDAKDNYINLNVTESDVSNATNALQSAINQAKADVTKAKINAIGTVSYTSKSKALIDDARNYYDNLDNQDQKDLVTNYENLTTAEELYNAVDEVVEEINNIGDAENTDLYREKVQSARASYEALKNSEKGIFPADVLTALNDKEKAIEVMDKVNAIGDVSYTTESKALIDAARTAYDGLTEAQKALVYNYDILTNAEKLYDVIDKINAIGTVSYTSESKALIDAARTAYNELPESQKALVDNYAKLTTAEATYKSFDDNAKSKAVDALISAIGKVEYNTTCKTKIGAAREAYDSLTADQKALVTNYKTLTDAEKRYDELELAATRHSLDDKEKGVEIETSDGTGIPKTITLKVEVKTTVSATEGSTAHANINAKLNNNEVISGVYDVKLIQTINGVEKVVQPSDIKAGTKIKIHITIPEGVKPEETRILHIHSENDIEYVENVEVVGNEFVFEVDRLSEFALVTLTHGIPGWAIALIVIGCVLLLCCGCYLLLFFVFNKWINKDGKAVRVFKLGKKDDKVRVIIMPCKFEYKEESEVFKTKEEAMK